MTTYKDLFMSAARKSNEDLPVVGAPADRFTNASVIASTMLGKVISPFEVSIIMAAVSLANLRTSPTHEGNYVDALGAFAMSGELSQDALSVEVRTEDQVRQMALQRLREPKPQEPAPQEPAPRAIAPAQTTGPTDEEITGEQSGLTAAQMAARLTTEYREEERQHLSQTN